MAKITLFDQLTRLAYALSESVQKGKVHTDTTNGLLYQNNTTDVDDYYLKDAVAIIDVSLFDNLSAHSCKFLLRIIKEMKMNNVFYVHHNPTCNERASLAQLKRQEILLPTERIGLYIINPFKLRRGKPLSTIMASLHHFRKSADIKLITDLRPPKSATI